MPNWVVWLLRLISSKSDFEYFLGDLQELYKQRKEAKPGKSLQFFLLRHLVSLIKPSILLKKLEQFKSDRWVAFSSNLKLSLRNFSKNRAYAFTALFVLTLGIFTASIITKFVLYETSFDRHYERSADLYRVMQHSEDPNDRFVSPMVPAPLGPAMSLDIDEIDLWSRICKFREEGIYRIDEQTTFSEPGYLWADASLLDLLEVEMIQGDAKTALTDPNALVVSESIAIKYFGTPFALDQVVTFRTNFYEDVQMKVTGVIKDLPKTSHLQFDLINSFKTLENYHFQEIIRDWGIDYYYTYLRLQEHADLPLITQKLNAVASKHIDSERMATTSFELEALTDIYLNPVGEGWLLGPSSDSRYVYFFSSIAILVLLMSMVNYVSLATAKSMKRAKEIGVRKAIGATKKQIRWQYLSESLLFSILAFILSMGLLVLSLPIANASFDRSISFTLANDWMLLLKLLGFSVATGILSGWYPTLVIASYKITTVLKNNGATRTGSLRLRNALVTVQFAASIVVLLSTVFVFRQLQYVRNADVGFEQDQLVVVPLGTQETIAKFDLLKTTLESGNHVLGFSAASQFVGSNQLFGEDFDFLDRESGETKTIPAVRFGVSHDFLDVLGTRLISGRTFDRNFPTDENQAIVVNEAFLKAAGIQDYESAIGSSIGVNFAWGESLDLKLIGVVNDFHLRSMKSNLEPAAFYIRPDDMSMAHIRINGSDIPGALLEIESKLKEVAPELAFNFFFQDERIASLYKSDRQLERLLYYLTVISICIAGLGLFSLSVQIIQQKRKEIGIRKVLGAKSVSLAGRFLLNFAKLMLIGLLIAAPVSFSITKEWLNSFAYRTSMDGTTILLILAMVLSIVICSTGSQVLKLIRLNPSKVLRDE